MKYPDEDAFSRSVAHVCGAADRLRKEAEVFLCPNATTLRLALALPKYFSCPPWLVADERLGGSCQIGLA